MLKHLIRMINVYKSKKKIIRKAKSLGKNIIINDEVKINSNTSFGSNIGINGLTIRGNGNVNIGNNISIAKGCLILTENHNYRTGIPFGKEKVNKDVIIEDNVWIGQNVIILGGVKIGEGAIIQAGAVVVHDIPKLALAGGNPASPFKYRNLKEYEELLKNNKINKFSHKKKYVINFQ